MDMPGLCDAGALGAKAASDESRATAILRWLANGDSGISSEVLAVTAVGITHDKWGSRAPGDEGDCGRCERLAEACPFVVEALPILATRNPNWIRWADRIRAAAERGLEAKRRKHSA